VLADLFEKRFLPSLENVHFLCSAASCKYSKTTWYNAASPTPAALYHVVLLYLTAAGLPWERFSEKRNMGPKKKNS